MWTVFQCVPTTADLQRSRNLCGCMLMSVHPWKCGNVSAAVVREDRLPPSFFLRGKGRRKERERKRLLRLRPAALSLLCGNEEGEGK